MKDALFNLWCSWRDQKRLKIMNADICYGDPGYMAGRLHRLDEEFDKNILRNLRPGAPCLID